MAHAFKPTNGETHFDEAEPWSRPSSTRGISLLSVAVHEIGHSIGLDHTYGPGDVMSPFFYSRAELTSNDILHAKAVYGMLSF